jgi:acyl-CoA synthetase (AMP-forming)/AMP-acid ligase II
MGGDGAADVFRHRGARSVHLARHRSLHRPRRRLAGFKCPTSVDFVAALPRTATGKVLKHVLREPYWHGYDRRIN